MTATLDSTPTAPVATLAGHPDQTLLWKRYSKAGHGSHYESELVERYLPLVRTVVGRVATTLPNHIDIQDLHSAGLVGLLDAVRRYDPKSGSSFETYARLRIRGAILDELRRMDWVPRSVREKSRKVQDAMQQLEQKKGKVPTEEEMARSMNLSLAEYQSMLDEIRPAAFVCLDSARGAENEEGAPQYESVPDDRQADPSDHAAQRELARLILDRLEMLPEMQRKVLALYYFEDLRLREIAEVFGVTESRICQIHAQAILSIKSYLHRTDPATL